MAVSLSPAYLASCSSRRVLEGLFGWAVAVKKVAVGCEL
jgi:hypothetical protein